MAGVMALSLRQQLDHYYRAGRYVLGRLLEKEDEMR